MRQRSTLTIRNEQQLNVSTICLEFDIFVSPFDDNKDWWHLLWRAPTALTLAADSALDRRSRPARERERERTEGGRTGEAGQRTGGQEDAPHHANHNRQAASALPSSAAQTSTNMHYQVTRTIVKLYIEFNKNNSLAREDSKHPHGCSSPCHHCTSHYVMFSVCFLFVFCEVVALEVWVQNSIGCTHTYTQTNKPRW